MSSNHDKGNQTGSSASGDGEMTAKPSPSSSLDKPKGRLDKKASWQETILNSEPVLPTMSTSYDSMASNENRSTHSRTYPCTKGCPSKVFESEKDLSRHYKSRAHHESTEGKYRCRCMHETARKDHYRRHLKHDSCTYKELNFRCICSHTEEFIAEQLSHIEACRVGTGRMGRPPKKSIQ